MVREPSIQGKQRLIQRAVPAAWGILMLAAVLLLMAILWPIEPQGEARDVSSMNSLPFRSDLQQDLRPLLVKMAGVRLIRPAQIQAAVKDTGTAKALLAKLKLQGVVRMGDDFVAYIQVEGQSSQSVREGGSVLDFVVQGVEPGKVTLALQGVQVELAH